VNFAGRVSDFPPLDAATNRALPVIVSYPMTVLVASSASGSVLLSKALKFYLPDPSVAYLVIDEENCLPDNLAQHRIGSPDQIHKPGFYWLKSDPSAISGIVMQLIEVWEKAPRPVGSDHANPPGTGCQTPVGNLLCFVTEDDQHLIRQDLPESASAILEQSITDPDRAVNWQADILCHPDAPVKANSVYDGLIRAERRRAETSAKKSTERKTSPASRLSRNSGSTIQPSYSVFASSYDRYMVHVSYDRWVRSILQWYDAYTRLPLSLIHETACGTANIGCRLVAQGYRVEASDLSPYMLMVADEKPFKPVLSRRNLIDHLPPDRYSLVLCMFDSLNYLTRVQDVTAAFSSVYESLQPGGLFIFDISTYKNSIDNFNDRVNISDSPDEYLIHQAQFNEQTGSQLTRLTLFQKNGIQYDRYDERHYQRVYSNQEICSLIDDTPLKLVAIHSMTTSQNLVRRRKSAIDHQYHRLFYILKRP